MKTLLATLFLAVFATAAFADIQEPPLAWDGPVRKLGRGLSNVLLGVSELPYNVAFVNETMGNNAVPYGVVRGLERTIYRFGQGWYDVVTAPFPTYKGCYSAPYALDIVWGHAGYSEFPPELGFESRYNYSRAY